MDPNYINPRLPSVAHLREHARKRMPGFAFDYLEGGCNTERNLRRNTEELREVLLRPEYLKDFEGASLETEILGETYAAPFGIAPVGLQGLMWPRATEILAEAAKVHNIPFVLSTVGTASIETVSEITEGRAWFQLYHPAEDDLRDKILQRAADSGMKVLVLLADTPTFGYRPREIKNGLSIPPKMSLSNILQMAMNPTWALSQLGAGIPEFKTLKPYIPKGLSMKHLGMFMNKTFSGRLSSDRIAAIRDQWDGKLVVKGITNPVDAAKALELGVDGLIVSNHGGRQIDSGQSAVASLADLRDEFSRKTTLMMDSGIREGSDVMNAVASGADFTFLGRTFMYGVGALGPQGGTHTIALLKKQAQQVMEQLGCESLSECRQRLIPAA